MAKNSRRKDQRTTTKNLNANERNMMVGSWILWGRNEQRSARRTTEMVVIRANRREEKRGKATTLGSR
uniref:Uncharacterized protein n=1 Tax=Cucumis melo TaxID=3656 RepID=A0A9I9D960_CUCME